MAAAATPAVHQLHRLRIPPPPRTDRALQRRITSSTTRSRWAEAVVAMAAATNGMTAADATAISNSGTPAIGSNVTTDDADATNAVAVGVRKVVRADRVVEEADKA